MPCLQRDDAVVMDNLATYRVAGVRAVIESAGEHPEHLPPYSPDFNPIEPMWSKVKQAVKSREPRNARQLLTAAAAAFGTITQSDFNSPPAEPQLRILD